MLLYLNTLPTAFILGTLFNNFLKYLFLPTYNIYLNENIEICLRWDIMALFYN